MGVGAGVLQAEGKAYVKRCQKKHYFQEYSKPEEEPEEDAQ